MTNISVILPVYDSQKYLYQCLETVLGQTFRDYEVILIDDGSTDNSYQICQGFAKKDNRIKVYHQENKGQDVARDRGIQLSAGEYLLFLDPKDFLELDMFQILYRRAKATNSDIVFCDNWTFDDDAKQDRGISKSIDIDLMVHKKSFAAQDCPATIFQIYPDTIGSALYKRDFILKNKISFESGDILFRYPALVSADKISYIDNKLYHCRVNTQDSSVSFVNNLYEKVDAYEKLYDFLIKKNLYYFYEKSFLNKIVSDCIKCMEYVKYPERLILEDYFANKVIHKYKVDLLSKKYFYIPTLFGKVRECIQSYNHSQTFQKWYKERRNKIIPVVLAINEKMGSYCGVTIQSIIENASKDRFYDIYVLYTDLSEHMKCKLDGMETNNIHINMVSSKTYLENQTFILNPKIPHISLETYLRFFIPSIFSYEKVLYLDCDLVVQSDIAELYDVELGNNLIAGVMHILSDNEEKIRIAWGVEPLSHVNAGVLLINNRLWQEEKIQQKCLDENVHPSHPWTLNDQDIIHFICQDRTLLVDAKWNFLYSAFCSKRDKYEARIGTINPLNFAIIHYCGPAKPWKAPKDKFMDIWWKYARKSPFYEVILHQLMQEVSEGRIFQLKQPSPVKKTIPKAPDKEQICHLRCAFIKKAFQYWFSFGQKKRICELELGAIIAKLKATE